MAVARHGLPRQPGRRPPRSRRRLLAGDGGVGGRLDRGPPEPARLHRTAGHRGRRGPRPLLALPAGRAQHRPAARGARRRRAAPRASGSRPAGWPTPPTAGCSSRSPAASTTSTCRCSRGCITARRRRSPSASTSTPGSARAAAAPAPAALGGHGWRAATLGPRDRLDKVWQDLGSSAARAGRVAADTTGAGAMRSRRPGLVEVLAMSVAAAATTWLATLAWRGFTRDPGGYLRPLLLLALLVALVGGGLRRLHAPGALVLLAQLRARRGGRHRADHRQPAPGGRRRRPSCCRRCDGGHQRPAVPRAASRPRPRSTRCWSSAAGPAWCWSTCAPGTLRRVSLAGLPLLAIYSIPVSVLGGGVAWWAFALTSAGFLLMLYLQHGEADRRAGAAAWRAAAAGSTASPRRSGPAPGSVGVAATALAVFAPLLVPTLSLGLFGFGPGDGPGSDIAVDNPMTDLRRDLLRTEDVPLLRVTTDDPSPSYLRIAALNRFNDNEWSTGDRDIPVDQRADGEVPLPGDRPRRPAGRSTTTRSTAPVRVRVALAAHPDPDLPDLRRRATGATTSRPSTSSPPTRTSTPPASPTPSPASTWTSTPRRWPTPPSAAGEVDSSYRDLPTDLPSPGRQPGPRGHPRLPQPLREGGGAAGLVPRGRRLRVLPRQRPVRQRPRRAHARSSPRAPTAGPATASSSPRRWRRWPGRSASPPGSRWAS